MNKNSDNKIKLTFHPAEFGAKMPIPLAEQSVKAGFPSPAQDYMEGEIDLNDILVRHREATFYVRISGDSMQDAGILDGDLAVVDRQIEPSNGNFVIAFEIRARRQVSFFDGRSSTRHAVDGVHQAAREQEAYARRKQNRKYGGEGHSLVTLVSERLVGFRKKNLRAVNPHMDRSDNFAVA